MTPNTDDSSRWKMIRILDHKEISAHKTELNVERDTGETTWLPLSIVKQSEPKLFEEYALISHGPWANN